MERTIFLDIMLMAHEMETAQRVRLREELAHLVVTRVQSRLTRMQVWKWPSRQYVLLTEEERQLARIVAVSVQLPDRLREILYEKEGVSVENIDDCTDHPRFVFFQSIGRRFLMYIRADTEIMLHRI